MIVTGLVACGGGAESGTQATRLLAGSAAAAVTAFGVTDASGYLTVASGAGLVFKVDKANGNITSITYNGGPELQDQTKGSHIGSGLGTGTAVTYSVICRCAA